MHTFWAFSFHSHSFVIIRIMNELNLSLAVDLLFTLRRKLMTKEKERK